MRIAKRTLSLLLCCLLLLFALPSVSAQDDTLIRGKCGSYAGYTLDTETGEVHVFMIGGAKSAYMSDFENGSSPFYGNTAIKSVVIEPWIWNVGSEAFAGCVNLEQVTFAFTLNRVGAHAFDGCDNAVFTFEGTENGWKNVKIEDGNDWAKAPERITFSMTALEHVSAVLPLPKAGDKLKLNQKLAVGDSGKYEAELLSVCVEENGRTTYLKDGDTLKANTAYRFEIAFYPLDGYAIEEETTFEVNGEPQNVEFGTVSLTVVPAQGSTELSGKPEDGKNTCPYCAKDHSGQPLGFLMQWFHSMLQFFKRIFKK